MRQTTVSPKHKRLMRSVRWAGHNQLGIEFTTIPRDLYRGYGGGSPVVDQFRDLSFQHPDHTLIEDVHSDPGCVEASSVILKGWGDVLRFTTLMLKTAAKLKCKQDSPYQTGGGGHIHISNRQWPDLSGGYYSGNDPASDSYRTLQSYCKTHPWIPWALNDPYDYNNAVVIHDYYDSAVRDCYSSIEFRFFDGARDINEQIEHVAFANRLFALGSKLPVLEPEDVEFKRPTLQEALAGWKKDILRLRLPYNLYKKYERNIRERYRLGRKYLN